MKSKQSKGFKETVAFDYSSNCQEPAWPREAFTRTEKSDVPWLAVRIRKKELLKTKNQNHLIRSINQKHPNTWQWSDLLFMQLKILQSTTSCTLVNFSSRSSCKDLQLHSVGSVIWENWEWANKSNHPRTVSEKRGKMETFKHIRLLLSPTFQGVINTYMWRKRGSV